MLPTTAFEMEDAVSLLQSQGFSICHPSSSLVPPCEDILELHRWLQEEDDEEIATGAGLWINAVAALFCVCMAALAAGLTLGMLGLDPLVLLIKNRAGESEAERTYAGTLLPLIKQHHRLLVTLLLMNSLANEALPIFLEKLVPPSVAVLLSVTLVLFFGEIIPSAIFTGPNQLALASSLTPVVKFFLIVLYPIAGPIAKLLDILLHDEEEMAAYNRGELSALVRIQYEERLASKRKKRAMRHQAEVDLARKLERESKPAASPLNFCNVVQDHRASLKEQDAHDIMHAIRPFFAKPERALSFTSDGSTSTRYTLTGHQFDGRASTVSEMGGDDSIHIDEVMIVEGALQMKTKVALDIMRPKRLVFCIPLDTILDEAAVVGIYSSGFSRIPVYVGTNRSSIIGTLITKQLIVVNPEDRRPLNTLPLYRPAVVPPSIRLVDLLNLMQKGGGGQRGGHLALVCADPKVGIAALEKGLPLPKEAGWMGMLTMEDILEELLQEEIYDEYDKLHKRRQLAIAVWAMWLRYKLRKRLKSKEGRKGATNNKDAPVLEAVSETTALLPTGKDDPKV